MEANEKDGPKSPFQHLEDQVRLLEAEMEMARQQFHEEEEEWQRCTDKMATENRVTIEADMAMVEDATMVEDAVASIQKQMKAEEDSIHLLYEGIPSTNASPEARDLMDQRDIECAIRREKNDVQNLTSMFEKKQSLATLPRPPPAPSSFQRSSSITASIGNRNISNPMSSKRLRASNIHENLHVNASNGASLSIKEGNAMFERALSPPDRKIRSNFQAKPKASQKDPDNEEKIGVFSKQDECYIATKPSSNISSRNITHRNPTNYVALSSPLSLRDSPSSVEKSNSNIRNASVGLQPSPINETSVDCVVNQDRKNVRDFEKEGADRRVSLSISEGKALFRGSFSPRTMPDHRGHVHSKVGMASQGLQQRGEKALEEIEEVNSIAAKASKNEIECYELTAVPTAAPLSLRDRVSMIEKSKFTKLPPPPAHSTEPVASVLVKLDTRESLVPEPEPLIVTPFEPNEPIVSKKGQGNIKRADPDGNEEACAVLSKQDEHFTVMKHPTDSVHPSTPTSARHNILTVEQSKSNMIADSERLQPSPTNGVRVNQYQRNVRNFKNAESNEEESLSIREGTTFFERESSPSHMPDYRGYSCSKPESQIKARISPRSSQYKDQCDRDDLKKESLDGTDEVRPRQGETCIVSKPSTNSIEGHVLAPNPASRPPSLRDRISTLEKSESVKMPSPSARRIKSVDSMIVDLDIGKSLAPGPEPLLLPPSEPNQLSESRGNQDNTKEVDTQNVMAMPPEDKVVVSPPIVATPVRRYPSSLCNGDGVIKQRRDALVEGLKFHLNEERSRSIELDNVNGAAIRGPCGIVYSTDKAILSSPIQSNIKHEATEEFLQRVHSPSQENTQNGSRSEVGEHSAVVHTSQASCGFWPYDVNEGQPPLTVNDQSFHTGTLERTQSNDASMNFVELELGNSPSLAGVNVSQVEHTLDERLFRKEISQPGVKEVQPSLPAVVFASAQINSRIRQLYNRSKSCITSVVGFFQSCISKIWNYFWGLIIFIWSKIAFVTVTVMKKVNDAFFSFQTFTRESLNNYRTMVSLAPDALKTIRSWVAKGEPARGVSLCFASITASMITDMYPTAPSYNIFILLFRTNIKFVDRSQYHSIFLVAATMTSICIDIDWISYKTLTTALDEQLSLAYRIQQETSVVWTIVWYSLVINCFIKVLCLNDYLKASTHGSYIRKLLWERGRKCFIASRIPDDLGAAVKDKTVALTCIELICAVLCFGYFFVIEFDGVSASVFRDVPIQILSLEGSLLIKATSGSLVFLSLAHHIRVIDFVDLFGCSLICPTLGNHLADRNHGRILSRMEKSFKCIIGVKALDFTAGAILWMSLASAHRRAGFDAPKGVNTLLIMIFATQMFTSIIAPIQGAVAFWYIRISTREQGTIHQRATIENPQSRSRRRNRKNHSVSNKTKRSNRHCSSNKFISRGSSFSNEGVSSSNFSNYDLKNPSNSQYLFETRLRVAAKATPMDELDPRVTCSPRQFQAEWQGLKKGFTLSQDCFKKEVPNLSDCHKHFHIRRFYVVGSGVVGNETKLFVVAQRQMITSANNPSPSTKKQWSRCLVEITFNSNIYEMRVELRCRNQEETRVFLSALDLKELFGERS